jgi:outer membrane protein TolC
VLFLGLAVGLTSAGAEPLTLQAAVDRALAVDPTYQRAVLAVDQARNSLVDFVNWKGIGVSATEKQTSGSAASGGTGAGAGSAATTTTTLGLNLPLFDQLGATATLDQDRNAQVSVTATPLAHSDTSTQNRIAYDKAVLAAAQARVTAETTVRKAWLARASAQAQYDVQVRKTALKATACQDARVRLDKGNVTLAEVRTALQDLTDAQAAQTTLERNLVKAGADLAQTLGEEVGDLAPLDTPALQALVAALGPVDTTPVTPTAVRTQSLEVESQKAKADATWALDPGLTVSGSASIPASGTVTWSGQATLTLSLGSWKGSDRSLADRSVDLARQSLAVQTSAARATETQARLAVEAASRTVESRALALTQAQDLLAQTQILVQAGKATALDLETAQLGVTSAQNDQFSAWADLYGARLDLAAARS